MHTETDPSSTAPDSNPSLSGDPLSSQNSSESSNLTRRTFIRTAVAAGSALAAPGLYTLSASAAPAKRPRNLIVFMNDQERAIQWFPPGWTEANMPGLTELQRTGVTFPNAFTNTAMCTPARSTFFSGKYPAQSLMANTLTEGFAQSESEIQLNPGLPNLATILKEGGYEVVYKGKFHLSKGVVDANGNYISDDIERYGFDGWNPPDAGQDTAMENYGGGDADNDGRYIADAIAYLESKIADPGDKPFCLVISLVNPHDVLGYPGLGNDGDWLDGGYTFADLQGDINLPPTLDEDLSANYKPSCQAALLQKLIGLGVLGTEHRMKNYLNFYGNLMKQNDQKLKQVLDLFKATEAGREMRRQTWIVRTADHGEMGLCHGGLRQKAFQCYEESIRIPLVWSNTTDYPEGRGLVCNHLVSHVDFVPTVCSTLLGMTNWKTRYGLTGVDYKALLTNPRASKGVQDYILFTYDDIYAAMNAEGQEEGTVPPPNRIRMIRTAEYKYALYFDGDGIAPDQEEFYDLRTASAGGTDVDAPTGLPVELINYSSWAEKQRKIDGKPLTIPRAISTQRTNLQRNLQTAITKSLKPLPTGVPLRPEVTEKMVTLPDGTPVKELFWVTLATTKYLVQETINDGASWEDVGGAFGGTNGPVLVDIVNPPPGAQHRVLWGTA